MKKAFLLLLITIQIQTFGQSIFLENVSIIDVVNNQILDSKTIEIKEGIIYKIHNDNYTITPNDTLINLKGKYAIPGLIDSHTHIEHSAYWSEASKYNPPRENLLDLLRHAVYGGLTTIREMACDVRVIGELSRAAKLNLIPSPNIYYPSLFAGPRFFEDPRADAGARGEIAGKISWFRGIDDTTDLPNAIAQAKGNSSHALKLYALLNAEQIKTIVQEAHNQNLKVWSHAYTQYAKPSEIMASGVDGVSHAPLLLYELNKKPDYSNYPEDDTLLQNVFKAMKANNVSFDPTLFVYNHVPKRQDRSKVAKTITQKAHEAGVRIIAGTDSISAYKEEKLPFIHKEMNFYANACDFSNMEALKTATINAAITLGINNETGSVEENKKANIIILDKNPLENISHTETIFFVIKDGIIFKDD